jgi:hypothetical protein
VIGRHCVIAPFTGEQVVVEHPVQSGEPPLQHARQNAIVLFVSSVAHALHDLQYSDTSHRSPVLPVGVQVPPVHV